MTSRPTSIRIGFLTYKVVDMPKKRAKKLDGNFIPHRNRIEISSNLLPAHAANTLLHETLHAILYGGGVVLDDEIEEHVVTVVANGLCHVLRDNPDFIEFVVEGLKEEET